MTTPAGPPGPPPARPPAPAYPYPEPVPYPRLLRTPSWAWWRAVLGAVVLLLGVFAVAPALLTPLLVAALYVQSKIEGVAYVASTSLEPITPATMLWLNLVLGSGTLIAFALVRWLHQLRPRWLTSVRPGMRWRFFGVCLGLSVVALATQVAASSLVPVDSTGEPAPSSQVNHLGWSALAFAIVILCTTPLQAMGEEYVFRGYLMQAFGSLFNTWTALVATSLLFALAHGSQNFPLFFDRFAFGLLAGFLVIRVGGLVAGIALHVLNNFAAYSFALLFGDITTILSVTETSWWNLPVTVLSNGVYLVLVLLVARRMGLSDRTAPPPGETLPTPAAGTGFSIGDATG
jgi:membrane protease YdiL (CAAX protease family)